MADRAFLTLASDTDLDEWSARLAEACPSQVCVLTPDTGREQVEAALEDVANEEGDYPARIGVTDAAWGDGAATPPFILETVPGALQFVSLPGSWFREWLANASGGTGEAQLLILHKLALWTVGRGAAAFLELEESVSWHMPSDVMSEWRLWRNETIRGWMRTSEGRSFLSELYAPERRETTLAQVKNLRQDLEEHLEDLATVRPSLGRALRQWRRIRVREAYESAAPVALPASANWLSLDVFDTCVGRRVRHPFAVFRILAERVTHLCGGGARRFAEARIQAEDRAREKMRAAGVSQDIKFTEIYQEVQKILNWTDTQREEAAALEEELEVELSWKHPEGSALYEAARASGRSIVFVSDMYHSDETIRRLLQHHGFDVGTLLVSANVGKTKGSGALFDVLQKQLQAEDASIFHYGDNAHSDLKMALDRGCLSAEMIYRPEQAALVDDPVLGPPPREELDLLSELSWGLARAASSAGAGALERIGYEVVGPCAVSYVTWLLQQASTEEWEDLWFLGRDGYYLRAVAERLASAWEVSVRSRYLISSRRLYGLACLQNIEAVDWDFLLKEAPGIRVRDIFERVGLEATAFEPLLERHGLPGPDHVLADSRGYCRIEDRDALYHVFVDLDASLRSQIRQEKEAALAFLESEGFLDTRRGAVIDLGWHGGSARALTRLRRESGRTALPVRYLASWREAQRVEEEDVDLKGFLADKGDPAAVAELFEGNVALVEFLFSAPHAGTEHLRSTALGPKPEYANEADSARRAAVLDVVWRSAFSFVDELLPWLPRLPEDPRPGEPYVLRSLDRLLRVPRRDEVVAFAGFRHPEGWGLSLSKPLCAMPTLADDDQRLVEDYLTAPWRGAFFEALTAEQRERLMVRMTEM